MKDNVVLEDKLLTVAHFLHQQVIQRHYDFIKATVWAL